MTLMRTAGTGFRWICAGLWALSGGILLFSIVSVIADVVLRISSVQASLPWVVEVNEYLLFAMTFFSAVWCLRKGGHVRIDFIYGLFSERSRRILSIGTGILGAAACLVFSFYGGYATWYSYIHGTHLFKFLKVPKYVFSLVICLCALLLAVEFVRQAKDQWKALRQRASASPTGVRG